MSFFCKEMPGKAKIQCFVFLSKTKRLVLKELCWQLYQWCLISGWHYENFASLITRNISDIVTMNCFLCRCFLVSNIIENERKNILGSPTKMIGDGLVVKSCPILATLWTVTLQFLYPWNFLGKNTGVGCHFLLQGKSPTQGSNTVLLNCRQTLY